MGAKLLLAFASVVATLLALEFLALPPLLRYTPLRLQIYLDDGIRSLAQSSKRRTVPENYVLIVGDSYAQGRGDWLLSVDAKRNPPFNSAHVFRANTGRDVVNFARGGSGSIRGLIVDPVAKYHYLRSSARFDLEPPRDVLVYFYEGNDLQDTLLELAVYFEGASDTELTDPDHFRKVVDEKILPNDPLERRAHDLGIGQELYLVRFLAAMLEANLGRAGGRVTAPQGHDVWPESPQRPIRRANSILSHGGQVDVGVELQGPAPELDARETDLALFAFEQSLRYLRDFFADADVCVVYLPSPAISYASAGETLILQTSQGRPRVWPSRQVELRSLELRRRVSEIAMRNGLDFVDATTPIRRQGKKRLLHGPTDWRHFNRAGYSLLGSAASACVKR